MEKWKCKKKQLDLLRHSGTVHTRNS